MIFDSSNCYSFMKKCSAIVSLRKPMNSRYLLPIAFLLNYDLFRAFWITTIVSMSLLLWAISNWDQSLLMWGLEL